MKIEIWSDIVCPFCYIGKRNFEKALETFPQKDEVEVEWKAFQLDPNFEQNPNEKLDLSESLAKKYNRSVEDMKQMQNQITQTAKTVGLDYDFDKAVTFNTFNAHRIINKAKEKGLDDKAEETFFKAYFTEGKDMGNSQVLKTLALEIGLNEDEINDALENDKYGYEVNQDIQEAQQLGVSGVPFFVVDRKYGVNGAQPVEAFTQTLEKAYEVWSASKKETKLDIVNGTSCSIDGICE